jgi:hypothetical protein
MQDASAAGATHPSAYTAGEVPVDRKDTSPTPLELPVDMTISFQPSTLVVQAGKIAWKLQQQRIYASRVPLSAVHGPVA